MHEKIDDGESKLQFTMLKFSQNRLLLTCSSRSGRSFSVQINIIQKLMSTSMEYICVRLFNFEFHMDSIIMIPYDMHSVVVRELLRQYQLLTFAT